jgi:hypothetical protein
VKTLFFVVLFFCVGLRVLCGCIFFQHPHTQLLTITSVEGLLRVCVYIYTIKIIILLFFKKHMYKDMFTYTIHMYKHMSINNNIYIYSLKNAIHHPQHPQQLI